MVHGVRAARRHGAVVPQPLGPLRGGRHRARRGGPRHARRQRLRRQHQRARARRAHARPRRGRIAAVRADPRARHRRAVRLRRHPAQPSRAPGLHRPPARGPRHRRAARGLLQLDCAATGSTTRCSTPSGRIRRSVEVAGARQPDDARLRAHRAARGDPRPAGHLRHRHGDRRRAATPARRLVRGALSRVIGRNPVPEPVDRPDRARRRGRPADAALPLEPRLPRAHRRAAARRATATTVRWFEIDPCYVFHTLNAYDDGDTVVVDVVRHPTGCSRPSSTAPTRARRR